MLLTNVKNGISCIGNQYHGAGFAKQAISLASKSKLKSCLEGMSCHEKRTRDEMLTNTSRQGRAIPCETHRTANPFLSRLIVI